MCKITYGISRCPVCPIFNMEIVDCEYCEHGSPTFQARCTNTWVVPLEAAWQERSIPARQCAMCYAANRVLAVTGSYLGASNSNPAATLHGYGYLPPTGSTFPIQPPNTPVSTNGFYRPNTASGSGSNRHSTQVSPTSASSAASTTMTNGSGSAGDHHQPRANRPALGPNFGQIFGQVGSRNILNSQPGRTEAALTNGLPLRPQVLPEGLPLRTEPIRVPSGPLNSHPVGPRNRRSNGNGSANGNNDDDGTNGANGVNGVNGAHN